MKSFIATLIPLLLLACSEPTETDKARAETDTSALLESCYTYANNRDTIVLKPVLDGTNIRGSLEYNYDEKDRNAGQINGSFKDGLLVAEYTFFSEGKQSVRQVVFKKGPNGLVEGYGEITEKDGKSVFKSIKALDYDENFVLRPKCP